MKIIDIENWPRKQTYKHFLQFEQPHINVCGQFDVTEAQAFCKNNKIQFFRFVLFAALRSANRILELRYRIRENSVVEHAAICCSFTVQTANNVIGFAWVDLKDNFSDFSKEIDRETIRIENGIDYSDQMRDDVIFLGCVPWSSFTSLSHPMRNRFDSIPKMTWGRIFDDKGILKMSMAGSVHHSLVDGFHLGQFDQIFQYFLNNPKELL